RTSTKYPWYGLDAMDFCPSSTIIVVFATLRKTEAAPSSMDTPQTDTPTADCQHYGFFLVDKFTLIGFASALEPLRMANLASGHRPFRWSTITKDGKAVRSSSGVPI